MKTKHLLLIIVLLLATKLKSQSTNDSLRNIIVGRYWCEVKQTDANFNVLFSGYYGWVDIQKDPSSDSTFYLNDSSIFGEGCTWYLWDPICVYPDTTLRSNTPCGSFCSGGKVFANDSITYQCKQCSSPYHLLFNGHKLYSYVGINELAQRENELIISPQPASDAMYIQSPQVSFKESEPPVLYDSKGRKISQQWQYINANTYKLDVTNLGAGMYVLAIESNKGTVRKKIVVQH